VRIKIIIVLSGVALMLSVVVLVIAFRLHEKDSEMPSMEIEEGYTVEESSAKFVNKLSEYVGSVVVSAYVEEPYENLAVNTVAHLCDENTAVYIYSVGYDRDTEEMFTSFYVYNSVNGETSDGTLTLSENMSEPEGVTVVREEYMGQITVIEGR